MPAPSRTMRRGTDSWPSFETRGRSPRSSELVIFLKLPWTALAFVIDSEPVV